MDREENRDLRPEPPRWEDHYPRDRVGCSWLIAFILIAGGLAGTLSGCDCRYDRHREEERRVEELRERREEDLRVRKAYDDHRRAEEELRRRK